ncbi:MAG: alpha/beta hydrolase [Actinomycetota bacterium]|nr:alpha/beta hydrolase [Actinomycetota bacterium]
MTGAGEPVTVVAHGLGESIAQTRPLLSGVPGTKVFLQARGHGRPHEGDAGYQALADDLLAGAGGASQALGVSLGAGALLRLMSQHPTRFARVVLYLPAALDQTRQLAVRRGAGLSAALAAPDAAAVEAWVRAELPVDLSGASVEAYVAARTAYLLTCDLAPLLSALEHDVPVTSPDELASVTADVLVVAQEGDPVHPVSVAREVVAALPRARLVAFARPGALFRDRSRLRDVISAHLTGPSGSTPSDQPGDAGGVGRARE